MIRKNTIHVEIIFDGVCVCVYSVVCSTTFYVKIRLNGNGVCVRR